MVADYLFVSVPCSQESQLHDCLIKKAICTGCLDTRLAYYTQTAY